tara:strand:+ start:11409 stop:12011 length:603 start_codon:yes stop_codon:yes gene_type:complete
MNRSQLTTITPKGTARWPKLNTPDTKFNQDGEYSCELILEDDATTTKYIASLDALFEEATEEVKAREKKTKADTYRRPWYPELNDAEEETGRTIIKTKLKALVRPKSGAEPFPKSPTLIDAKGQKMTDLIGPGSALRIKTEMFPWFTPTLGVGVTMQIKTVQVIELCENDDTAGFDIIDDGFETAASVPEAEGVADGGDF